MFQLWQKKSLCQYLSRAVKKLVSVLTTFSSMTETRKMDYVSLKWVPCIYYLLCFQKDTANVRALVDSGSKVNAMTPPYASKLGLKVHPTNVGAWKIDISTLDTFKMVLADFQLEDKLGRAWFFQETFLVSNTTLEVILGMPFLIFSRVDIQFT